MKSAQPNNCVRIIAGNWRGRKLAFPAVAGLRPTPDRVRETLFNWLDPEIRGRRCLDLYAGSGALGIEAASRGAVEVVLVEKHPRIAMNLREQLQRLDARQVQVVEADVADYLAGTSPPFDIVFLDPPFHEGRLQACMEALKAGDWLSKEAWVYIEAEHGFKPELPEHWRLHRSKQAGQVDYHLLRCVRND